MDRKELWLLSEKEVIRLGIPFRCKGYYYLIIAVVLSVETGMSKASLSKDIYCRIAELHEVSSQSVEKCIRNCVINAWSDEKSGLRGICSAGRKKPTNGEIIAYISSRIRLETAIRVW